MPLGLIALATVSTAALASAGGRYHREPPKPTPQEERAAAEAASQETWESLSQQVPDLEQDESRDASPVALVPKATDVEPEKRVCKRVAVEGTRIKRRVCTSVRETTAEARKRNLHSEALLRYKMFQ